MLTSPASKSRRDQPKLSRTRGNGRDRLVQPKRRDATDSSAGDKPRDIQTKSGWQHAKTLGLTGALSLKSGSRLATEIDKIITHSSRHGAIQPIERKTRIRDGGKAEGKIKHNSI